MADHDRVIFWDFDGTLGYRSGGWSGVMAGLLAEHVPGCDKIGEAAIRPHLASGFPWQTPALPHPELCDPDRWWQSLSVGLARAYECVGLEAPRAQALAGMVRERYVEPAGFVLFDDTLETLAGLAERGWRHHILSNHVPELGRILAALGLLDLVDGVTNSAVIGYEKPHVEAYRAALAAAGHPQVAWMVGDNVVADVLGAQAAGLQAILVRREDPRARYSCADLREVAALISAQSRLLI